MRGLFSLAALQLFGCTATSTPLPTLTTPVTPGPPRLEVESGHIYTFCEGEERCYLSEGLHYLASGAISFTIYDRSDTSGQNPILTNWAAYPDGSWTSRNCEYIAEINGMVHCSNPEPLLEGSLDSQGYRVSVTGDEGPYWHIDTPFFIGCDPDGDGVQGICTGTGVDQPPFDGVQEIQWYENETRIPTWGMDRPGQEPLFLNRGFFGEPEIASVMQGATPTRLDGENVFIGGHEGFLSVTSALPPHTVQHLIPIGPGQDAMLGHFLPNHDTLVLLFEGFEMRLYTFDGELLAIAELDFTPVGSGTGGSSRIAFDIDGDGLEELVWEDGEVLRAVHFPALP